MHIWKTGTREDYPEGTVLRGTVGANEYFKDRNMTLVTHFIGRHDPEHPGAAGELYAYGIIGPKSLIDQHGIRLRAADRFSFPMIEIDVVLPDGSIAEQMKFTRATHTQDTWTQVQQPEGHGMFSAFMYTELLNPNYLDRRKPEERLTSRMLTIRNEDAITAPPHWHDPQRQKQMAEQWFNDLDGQVSLALHQDWAAPLFEIEQINGHISPLTTCGFVGIISEIDEESLKKNIENLYKMNKLVRPEPRETE